MNETAAAGDPIPPDLSTKAKAVAALVASVVAVATSAGVLALVPDQYDGWVVAGGAFLVTVVNAVAVLLTPNKLTAPIIVNPAPQV